MAAVVGDRVLSLRGYRDSLTAENRATYDAKLQLTANIDPYSASANFFAQSMVKWPEIEFPDIVNYLLFYTSKFTKEQVKAYKSLLLFHFLTVFRLYSLCTNCNFLYLGNLTNLNVKLRRLRRKTY